MPPGKLLQPCLQKKVDELFLRWLSDPDTQRALHDGLRRILDRAGHDGTEEDSAADRGEDGGSGTPGMPCAPPTPPVRTVRRTTGAGTIPSFFPRGRPLNAVDVEADIGTIERVFAQFPQERAKLEHMGAVAKACGCPLYWKAPLFYGAGGEHEGSVSVHDFLAMWRKILLTCHDDAAKFVQMLTYPGNRGLGQGDFVPFLQDVVNTHPGLWFLKEASEFHSPYITTVIQRIFYTVNRSWSGSISCEELRRSHFLQAVALLEAEPDINHVTDFFSYEHFYVIYCKFWELDTDHDLLIDRRDLGRHGDHAISSRMIDRIFSGAVTRGCHTRKDRKMTYADFVWFLISEEDKTTPTSVEYWFRLMDLDGDGVLSMFELEFFYEEQTHRLRTRGVEPLPFRDLACQMLDLVAPQTPGRITLRDLKRCKLAGVFFDTFFNVDKYLEHEQKEQACLLRDMESEGPELSEWEKYAAKEYDFLVAEEATEDTWEDVLDADLSPKEQKLRMALGDVDLYDITDDDTQAL
ncbi:serine serine/threonine-protein phosphatase 2A regulatory subunit B subunit beta [Sigmodon hispidus]